MYIYLEISYLFSALDNVLPKKLCRIDNERLLKMLDDKQLIKKCLKDRDSAFQELYERFSSKMFGVCLRYARNYHDAEDLLHDGFIRVIEKMKDYRGEGSLNGWMRRIMVTTAINYYRKKSANSFAMDSNEVTVSDDNYEDIKIKENEYEKVI